MKGSEDYYLGLDIGTNSLGWAVTDTDYNILAVHHKAAWGIHLFDEGKTAEERRLHRCARRRLNRRKQRVTLLRELFSEEVCKVDPSFFERLDSSSLFVEDRKEKQKNSLFNDPDFTDDDYHRRFPTIYHLRKYLIETDEKPDIRLVYLACHHIVKYRGHFLFGEMEADKVPDFSDAVDSLVESLAAVDPTIIITDPQKLSEVLSDRNLTVNDKKRAVAELVIGDSAMAKEVCALLSGGKVTLSKLFDNEAYKDLKICFKDASVEDAMSALEDELDPDLFHILRVSKKIYDWSLLTCLLSGFSSISDSKMHSYEQHQSDLALLKKAVRKYAPEKYREIFKDKAVKGNYCSYVGKCNKGKPKDTCNQEEFCKFVNSILSKTGAKDDGNFAGLMSRLAAGTLMPKQTSIENGVLPYSVHRTELKAILDNASRFYPFLSEVDDDGFSVMEKVCMIQCFRIPYYVGPLGKGSKNAWAVRRSDRRITPWEFDKIVDLDSSAEGFMDNLTNYCTYMVGEKVLPKDSILYSKFQLYNELNNLRIDGERLPKCIKPIMVEELFGKSKTRVTKKRILTFLVSHGVIDKDGEHEITGMAGDAIQATLKSKQMLEGAIHDKAADEKLCEDIIRTITVFGDESRIRKKLDADHPGKFTEQELKALSKLRFEGWGRLSKKLLTGLYDMCPETGTEMNIIQMLESTDRNFMEIYNKFSFHEQVDKHNRSMTTDDEITYQTLESMYMSPAVRRATWRTISVVRDVIDCIGHEPKKVFVETTRDVRGANEGKRSDSRKDNLVQMYKACREDPQWISDLESREEADLKSRNVYLYYTQLGRCMYCGRAINFDELNRTDSVDRDHIYPQSKTKDDSIHSNMVLACKVCNGKKGNSYPISFDVQQKMRPMWDMLLHKKYIRPEKHARLVRTDSLTEEELSKFISRQLVETSQSVKATIEVLKRLFGNGTDLVYVRGGLVSEFRQEYGFIKCRSVNDYHHAKDAYLNIVVGNVYDTKFTKNPMNIIKRGESYNIGKMYERNVERNGIVAWIPGESGTISTVRKNMRRDNILFTKYQYIAKGALFDDNLVRASETLHDRKKGLPASKYGGFDNATGSCYSLVEYEVKGKRVRSLEVLHHYNIRLLNDIPSLKTHYSERIGADVKVIIPSIRMNVLFEWDGFRMHIGGRTGNGIVFYPAVQLLVPDDMYAYCKELYKYDDDRKNRAMKGKAYYSRITDESNAMLYNKLLEKIGSAPFSPIFDALYSNMVKMQSAFVESETLVQADILNGILSALHCNSESTSFKAIGGVGLTGRIIVNKKLTRGKPIYVVNQSPSGLRESRTRVDV